METKAGMKTKTKTETREIVIRFKVSAGMASHLEKMRSATGMTDAQLFQLAISVLGLHLEAMSAKHAIVIDMGMTGLVGKRARRVFKLPVVLKTPYGNMPS